MTMTTNATNVQAVMPGGPQADAGDLSVRELADLAWDGDGRARETYDPADLRHNNARRAGFALTALTAYAERVGCGNEATESTIRDLLADIRHLGDALGIDLDGTARAATECYADEAWLR